MTRPDAISPRLSPPTSPTRSAPTAPLGAWVLLAQVVSPDGDNGYLYEGDGSIFARAGIAHAYLTNMYQEDNS